MDVAPNPTLYIANLPDKLRKTEVRKCLYALFGQFGKVLEVVCFGTERLRGQAWVAFSDIAAAVDALRSLQGFPFCDKPMKIQFARSSPDAVARLGGRKKGEKKQKATADKHHIAITATVPAHLRQAAMHVAELGPVHHTLFVENLPPATNEAMLSVLFTQFPGFQQARLVPAKPGIAFIDFVNDTQASSALTGLQGFKVTPHHELRITYAKR